MEYRYRSADEMKDSEVEWIGEIPKDWELKYLKYIIKNNEGGTWGEERKYNNDTIVIRSTEVDEGGKWKIHDPAIRQISEKEKQRCILLEGDLLITKSSGSEKHIGKTAIITSEIEQMKCVFSNFMQRIRVKNVNSSKLLFYIMNSNLSKLQINYLSTTTTGLVNINSELINRIKIPIAILSEQEKIANFLDEKTSQFDLIISKKEELIKKLEEAKKSLISEVVTGKVRVVKSHDGYELVKRSSEEMKDSGVEWLGDIPTDWEVKRIKQISSVISKGTTPSTIGKETIDNGEIRYFKAENIYGGKISLIPEFFIDEETNRILKRSELKVNDILFVIAGATIGKNAIIKKEHCPANTNQAVSFIRLYSDINYKFVYYWLNSPKLQENIWLYAVQSAQPNLSMENLGNFYITYPNEDEMNMLVEYIEIKVIKIIKIIDNIKRQIEKIKQAKQSLISEAVTGKIEILD